jgi:hypothetical protein
MRRLKRVLTPALSLILLSGCATAPTRPSGAIDASSAGRGVDARKQLIREQLRPLCGSPTQWTAEQRKTVSDFVEKTALDPGQQLEAAELDRLARQVQVCRGGKPTTS